ncbi:2-oxoglutarate and iron-dependent oxygenase domain-containing protein 3-like [Sabethes cyaneus]|uniref:2-oxoglutarate and iron-dependent oxygenase domain-containing protein 3-like n=1 Tax=Sabethes cyaneus TaxID=53552 RepID=UPI00237DDEB1|nr:2-oxoglutarate and iron-dependent oxygenase domain-containing protein 3-like [Sabethes cyaneus]
MSDSTVRQRKKSAGEGKPRKVKIPHSSQTDASQQNRMWARLVLIIGIAIVVYFTTFRTREKKFATQKETLELRSQNLDCSKSYSEEIGKFPGCSPNICGRFVTDTLVAVEEVDILLNLARSGFQFGRSSGGASILDLHSGALSKDTQFINIYKIPEAKQIFTTDHINTYKLVKEKVQQAVSNIFKINGDSLFLTHPTFFSRLTNESAKTIHDEYWHAHIDKDTYSSFHYTTLLYLTDFGKDFTGGRFVFIDNPGKHNKTNVYIEPKRGRVSGFTSGAENVHHVEQVASGVRYALTISFTCNKEHAMVDPQFAIEEDDEP